MDHGDERGEDRRTRQFAHPLVGVQSGQEVGDASVACHWIGGLLHAVPSGDERAKVVGVELLQHERFELNEQLGLSESFFATRIPNLYTVSNPQHSGEWSVVIACDAARDQHRHFRVARAEAFHEIAHRGPLPGFPDFVEAIEKENGLTVLDGFSQKTLRERERQLGL
ncbi:MAG TPA: hypothetical protein VNN08_03095, partial [Thermoanaerobaculia bacterium]|nr:hypothetical protein [Thermoanaerobaculia bacterium]